IYDENCQGPIHVLCFFPTLQSIKQFSQWLVGKMKNITLSSQRYYGSATALQEKTYELNGLFIPAHVFTPFKSMYGKGVHQSLLEVRSEEHTSELQSRFDLVCRLLLEQKDKQYDET